MKAQNQVAITDNETETSAYRCQE